jgi:glycosyltransferase involved in cell wall biosynthesis
MAGGLALVSSLRGELEQLFERHCNGVTYHADSAEELVRILRDLYHNPQKCREMRERSRRTFEDYFDISTVARRMVEHMESVSASGARRPDVRVPIFPTNFGTSDNCKEIMR